MNHNPVAPCLACGRIVALSAAACPHCGRRMKRPWWPLLLVFPILVLYFLRDCQNLRGALFGD